MKFVFGNYNFQSLYNGFRRDIAAAVGRLCQQGITAGTKESNMDWLFVLPFYHFMKGISEPFMTPEYDPEMIVFDNKLEINRKLQPGLVSKLKESVYIYFSKLTLLFRCVNNLYMELEPLFAADPMLLHVFIAMCSRKDYLSLFMKVPTYLSLTWVSHQPRLVTHVNWGDVSYCCISTVVVTVCISSCKVHKSM